jgi:RNA polymerase sigma factor (TIGR02999 family)
MPANDAQPEISSDVSTLLRAWSDGEPGALDQLAPLVLAELHRLAHRQMGRERAGHSLQTTALVNEAYLRLVDCNRMRWVDRAHFFAVSAQLMRRILIDNARRHNLTRGAEVEHVPIELAEVASEGRHPDLLALDDALSSLAKFDPRKARIVELRFFAGLTVDQTASVLKVSSITVIRDWNNAKAWLYRELNKRETAANFHHES